MKVLAVDYGTRRLGLAVGEDEHILSSKTESIKSDREAVDKIAEIVAAGEINAVVLGLPLRLDGTERQEANKIRQIGKLISTKTKVPSVFVDERLTTVEADSLLKEQGLSEEERRQSVDRKAAELLLEQYYREQSERQTQ